MRIRILWIVLVLLAGLACLLRPSRSALLSTVASDVTQEPRQGPSVEWAATIEELEHDLRVEAAVQASKPSFEAGWDKVIAAGDSVDAFHARMWGDAPLSPEDPIEIGSNTLLLKLVDAKTGARQKGFVELWRLNAPGNVNWSKGDQLQVSAVVLHDGREFERLPAGVYRAVSMSSAAGAGYAGTFRVGGAFTEHTMHVQAPRPIETFVEFYDPSGVRVEEIEMKEAGRVWSRRDPGSPPWLETRLANHEVVIPSGGGGDGGFRVRSHSSWRVVHAKERGFELGFLLQNSRERTNRYRFQFRVPDGGMLELEIDQLPEFGSHLAAVFVSEQDVLQQLRLLDSGDDASVALTTRVTAHPILVESSQSNASWRDASVEVACFHEGSQVWSRRWKPAESPAPIFGTVDEE